MREMFGIWLMPTKMHMTTKPVKVDIIRTVLRKNPFSLDPATRRVFLITATMRVPYPASAMATVRKTGSKMLKGYPKKFCLRREGVSLCFQNRRQKWEPRTEAVVIWGFFPKKAEIQIIKTRATANWTTE